jgi:hypothetical protein
LNCFSFSSSFTMLSRCSRSAARLLPLGSSRAIVSRASIVPSIRSAPQSRGVSSSPDAQHKVCGLKGFNGKLDTYTDLLTAAIVLP